MKISTIIIFSLLSLGCSTPQLVMPEIKERAIINRITSGSKTFIITEEIGYDNSVWTTMKDEETGMKTIERIK